MGVFSANFNREVRIRRTYDGVRTLSSHRSTDALSVNKHGDPVMFTATKYGIYSYRAANIRTDDDLRDDHAKHSKQEDRSDADNTRGLDNFLYSSYVWVKNMLHQRQPPAPNHTLGAFASGRICVPVLFDPFMVFAYHSVMIPATIDR